jgi:hypothetical protein
MFAPASHDLTVNILPVYCQGSNKGGCLGRLSTCHDPDCSSVLAKFDYDLGVLFAMIRTVTIVMAGWIGWMRM